MFSIIPVGWRVKSSSLSLDTLSPWLNPLFQKEIKNIIEAKRNEVNECFFPVTWGDLRTRLKKGFLRPYIKTDQGMPWNFYPFRISDTISIEERYNFSEEHYEAILEPKYSDHIDFSTASLIKNAYVLKDLQQVFTCLNHISLDKDRSIIKWRSLFFVCRPSSTDRLIEISSSIIPDIEDKINILFQQWSEYAISLMKNYKSDNILSSEDLLWSVLYFQPDVYIDATWSIEIEKINLPDVWFFLEKFSDFWSLWEIKDINRKLRKDVINKIIQLNKDTICFLTNSYVLDDKEDLLEIYEIDTLKEDLMDNGVSLVPIDLNSLDYAISNDIPILLWNINYNLIKDADKNKILEYAINYPELFKPNPFLQIAMQKISWFRKVSTIWVTEQYKKKLLAQLLTISNTNPKNESDFERLSDTIQKLYRNIWFSEKTTITHISNDKGDFYPIHMQSLASMWKMNEFIKSNDWNINFVEIPYISDNQKIKKHNWNLLHFYRFMGLNNDSNT